MFSAGHTVRVVSLLATLALTPMVVVGISGATNAADLDLPSAVGLSAGARGTVLVDAADRDATAAVRTAGGRKLAGYGAYSLWTVPTRARDEVSELDSVSTPNAMNRVLLRGTTLNTSTDVPAPAELSAAPSTGSQLRILQFAGPVKQAWLDQIKASGATPVSYLPDNAYVVWGSAASAVALDSLIGSNPAVQYSGPYDPAYRLAPALAKKAVEAKGDSSVDITVQVVDADRASLAAVTAGRSVIAKPYHLLGLATVSVRATVSDLATIASLPGVFDVEEHVAPRLDDERQGQLLAGNTTVSGGATVPTGPGYLTWLANHGFPTSSASYPLVAVVDDGIDDGDDTPQHPDFFNLGDTSSTDRLTSNANCTTDASANGVAGHGNLNAGIVGGYNNSAGSAFADTDGYHYGLGVSPYGRIAGVKIFKNSGTYDDSACGGSLAGIIQKAYDLGAQITNNSWGSDVAGAYDADAQAMDALTRDASASTAGNQQMLHVLSAGNAGSGASTVGSPGTAKNVLTVGASENVRENGTLDGCAFGDANNADDIASFSSRGPTTDGRAKPDLVAAGTHITGPASQDPGYDGSGVCGDASGKYHPVANTLYTWSSGTSHSAPAVAGAASLTQEYYARQIAPGATASPAMLRALLGNVPRYLNGVGSGGTLPTASQGWGVPNLGMLFDPSTARIVQDQDHLFTASGQSTTTTASVADPAKPLRVTLAWTDAPGATTGASYVNNLDLVVVAGGKTYRGNVFSGATSTVGGTADAKNNLENVWLPAGVTGPVSVRVVATGIAGDGVPGNGTALDQDFALTASNLTEGDQPVLGAAGLTYTDSDLDANTTIDLGEPITVRAAVTNSGTAAAAAGTGSLEVLSGAATVVRGSSTFAAIAPGATGSNLVDYLVRINPSASCGSTVVLRHTYLASGQTVTDDLTLRIGSDPVPSTSFTTVASTDVPKAIPDNNPAGVTSTLNAAAIGTGTVGTVKVRMNVTHTWDGDVSATLVSPAGTSIPLVTRRGNSGDNFVNTVFDDAAATAIGAGVPSFTGSFRPESPLLTLRGESMVGTWKLFLTDSANTDTGTLTSWSLDIAPMLPPACVSTGAYADITPVAPVAEGAGSAAVRVDLVNASPGSSYNLTVQTQDGTATAPGDYAATTTTLTWPAGDSSARTVTVPLTDDYVMEGDETFSLVATSGNLAATSTTVRILDDDLDTRIAVGDPTPAAESDEMIQFPVTLTDSYPSSTYTVHVTTADGTAVAGADYTGLDQTITFAPSSPRTQLVSVPVSDDDVDEPDEDLTLTLSAATGLDSGPAAIDRATATGVIVDNDPTPVVSVADATANESDPAAEFKITLTNPRSIPVSVDWRTRAGSASGEGDYEPSHGTITFAPGETVAIVQVPLISDTVDEPDETFSVHLLNPVGVDLGDDSAVGTITDDDGTPTISIGDVKAVEGAKGMRNFTFTITLSAPSDRLVAFRWATADKTAKAKSKDYIAGSGMGFFDVGQTTTTVVVKVRGDKTKERAEKFLVKGSTVINATWARSVGTGTIVNDDKRR